MIVSTAMLTCCNVIIQAADYSSYATPYAVTHPYAAAAAAAAYYPYMTTGGATAALQSSQTYQLLASPSATGASQSL